MNTASRERDTIAIFAHSRKDCFLVLLSAVNLGVIVFGLFAYNGLRWSSLLLLAGALIFLNCTNYQCVAHNFLHNPFFRTAWLNNFFSVLNSLSLGVPQTLYKYHHLNHHQFNNDPRDSKTGTTRDHSSTFRHARTLGREENILTYALFGPLRTDLVSLYKAAHSHRRGTMVWVEAAAMLAFAVILVRLNPPYAVKFLLPVWYLGQAAALAENYLEHHFAIPGDRLTDSVSCYNRLYNVLWFNNGFHQEHHFRPTVHWTKISELRTVMLPETRRRVVRFAHWFNFSRNRSSEAPRNDG